jgi:hypothetical protein
LESWLKKPRFLLDEEDTVPKFWLRQLKDAQTYRIAKMGLNIISIPVMSAECERVFSQGKLLITGQRNRLSADIIEATQCLRMWLTRGRAEYLHGGTAKLFFFLFYI